MNEFTIRLATPEDAVGIATIHVNTWQCAYRGQIPDEYLDSLSVEKRMETWKKELDHPPKDSRALVAVIDQQIIGWCTFGVSRDADANQNTGELYGIYVHPNFQGKGAGSALMQAALNGLVQIGFIRATLWVLESNHSSRSFYEAKGWAIEETTKDEQREGFVLHEVRYGIQLRQSIHEKT